jgi:hypothetical protein
VPGPLLFRDDQVEALPDGLGGRVAKDALGPAVPQHDDAVGIADHDRLGGLAHDRLGQPVLVHGASPFAAAPKSNINS